MILSIALLALVTAQRLGELVLAQHNTARLKAAGAYEVAPEHYPLIVALHVATALALLLFFKDDWVRVIQGLVSSIQRKRIKTPYEKLAWLLVFSTIPVGLAGVVLDKVLRTSLGKPVYAGVFLMLNGLVLYLAERGGGKSGQAKAQRGGRRGRGTRPSPSSW